MAQTVQKQGKLLHSELTVAMGFSTCKSVAPLNVGSMHGYNAPLYLIAFFVSILLVPSLHPKYSVDVHIVL